MLLTSLIGKSLSHRGLYWLASQIPFQDLPAVPSLAEGFPSSTVTKDATFWPWPGDERFPKLAERAVSTLCHRCLSDATALTCLCFA